jgi:hypothetical protein
MNGNADELEEDLRWREAELASLKRLAIVNSDNEVVYRATLRACWTLLYAHFEGFTKFAWEFLLDKIEYERVLIKDLSKEFQLLALEKVFRVLRGNMASESLWLFFITTLSEEVNKQAVFYSDCRLETESNLWPNIFERECARIGISSNALEESRSRIKALVARRNDIAHGKSMTIRSVEEYAEYENATFLIFHDLAVQILEVIEERQYIRANNSLQPTAQSAGRFAPGTLGSG